MADELDKAIAAAEAKAAAKAKQKAAEKDRKAQEKGQAKLRSKWSTKLAEASAKRGSARDYRGRAMSAATGTGRSGRVDLEGAKRYRDTSRTKETEANQRFGEFQSLANSSDNAKQNRENLSESQVRMKAMRAAMEKAAPPKRAPSPPGNERKPAPAAAPTPPQAGEPVPPGRRYRVQRGDNLSKIAKAQGVTVSDLVRRNAIKNPNRIYAGQELDY